MTSAEKHGVRDEPPIDSSPGESLGQKFAMPPSRPGDVDRAELLARLRGVVAPKVVTIVAPAGYGKTTLMAQWANQDDRPTAWLNLGTDDNDPALLVRAMAEGLAAQGLIAAEASSRVGVSSERALTQGISQLVANLADVPGYGLIMLDHAESLTSQRSKDVIAEFASRLPPHMTLVIGSRVEPPIKTSQLRLKGRLFEVTSNDLALSDPEGHALLDALGIDLGIHFDDMMRRTEGWATGLCLAALSVAAGVDPDQAVMTGGDDRFTADYLREEITSRLTPATRKFLLETSILDTMCGGLCDAVLDAGDSDRVLQRFARGSMLMVSLDRTRTWYRYHNLLRDHLRGELMRTNPDRASELHSNAARWFALHSMVVPAVRHAQLAGDVELVATLVERNGRATFATGSIDTVVSWLNWLEAEGSLADHSELVLQRALAGALTGDESTVERWMSIAFERGDAASGNLAALLLRCLAMPDGIEGLRADVLAAAEPSLRTADWHHVSLLIRGMALIWTEDIDHADDLLRRASVEANRIGAPPTASLALALRAGIAIEEGHHDEADEVASRAVSLVRDNGLEGSATSYLPLVVHARCATNRGNIEEAERLLAEASTLRPLLSKATPGLSVHGLLETAKAAIGVADFTGARHLLREAQDILHVQPDLGTLTVLFHELRDRLASLPLGGMGASSLSNAELRVLPLLATHLSFPEIGDRLFVSRHTVKTQAISIYRKLDVSSRSQAVTRAREIGLLGP